MTPRGHFTDYDEETTALCERALVTLLGDLGPWRERIYLAGGLAPKYIVGHLPEGARAHVGTADVDLVLGLALGDETEETYRTLKNNLEKSGFHQDQPSYRWSRGADAGRVLVEFLCETDEVPPGGIFRPKGESTGSGFAAFNVRGAHLVRDDYLDRQIEAERLDSGGRSRVLMRVANLMPYAVLKILAFQDRHANKDAYDLVFTILNYPGGPRVAGEAASKSAVAAHPQVRGAIALLGERFADAEADGPSAYAGFLAEGENSEEYRRFRREAVATVREFLVGIGAVP